MVKNIFDFVASLIALVILLPIIIIIALISIPFQGLPIFFYHKRLGKNGNSFTMIKFRTMTVGPSLDAQHDEARLTNWGKFLRNNSIDEFPVLFNVLKGEMSLVGPRPLPIKYLKRFNKYQLRRLNVKPGITGLAQTNGRNKLAWDERFKFDIDYVNNHSFLKDLIIILNTIRIVIKRSDVDAEKQKIMPEFMGSTKETKRK